MPVKTQDLSVRISASGTAIPLQKLNLSPKTSGRLVQLYVEQGQILAQAEARLALIRATGGLTMLLPEFSYL